MEEAAEDAAIQELPRTKPRVERERRGCQTAGMELQPLQLPSASCQVVVKCLFLMTEVAGQQCEDAVMTDALFTILQALVRLTQDVSFSLEISVAWSYVHLFIRRPSVRRKVKETEMNSQVMVISLSRPHPRDEKIVRLIPSAPPGSDLYMELQTQCVLLELIGQGIAKP